MGTNVPPTAPRQPLGYAQKQTDAERDLKSLDRAMAARLSRIFGVCLLVFGVVLFFLSMSGGSRVARNAPTLVIVLTFAVPLGMYVLPGIVLLACVGPLAFRTRTPPIVVLITSAW